MAITKFVISELDLNGSSLKSITATSSATRVFRVADAITCTVQVVLASTSGSGSRSSWSVRVSNDGTNFVDYLAAVTVAPGAMSDILDASGAMFIQVSNAVANGGALSSYSTETVNIIVCTQA